jgi:hypothetical protein
MFEPELHFNGTAYVAFSDLCGFKRMMKERQNAYAALNHLFNSTYELLNNNHSVKALAVSDCVISWANNQRLQSITDFTAQLHRRMIAQGYLMKTTIAYGDFEYQDRIKLPNLGKEMIRGGAYLTAFIRNEKLEAGRIVLVENDPQPDILQNEPLWEKTGNRWEYFWSANSAADIQRIKSARKEANNAKYELLKGIYANTRHYR